jgi:hypothetical protein
MWPTMKKTFWDEHFGVVPSICTLWYPKSRVRTRPMPSDFSGGKILSMPSFGGNVKPSVPCRRFSASQRTLWFTWKSGSQAKLTGHLSPVIPFFADSSFLTHPTNLHYQRSPLTPAQLSPSYTHPIVHPLPNNSNHSTRSQNPNHLASILRM